MVGGLASLGEPIVRSLALVRPCLGLSPSPPVIVPTFLPSIFHTTLLLLFLCLLLPLPSSLLFPMREVYCVGYTPCAWDPRSLQSILDVPLVFRSFTTSSQRLNTLSLVYNNNNNTSMRIIFHTET